MTEIKKDRIMPTLIAGDNIVGVSPMAPPSSDIFKLRKKEQEDDHPTLAELYAGTALKEH